MLRTRRRTIPITRKAQPANPSRPAIASFPIVDNMPEAISMDAATARLIFEDTLRIFNLFYHCIAINVILFPGPTTVF